MKAFDDTSMDRFSPLHQLTIFSLSNCHRYVVLELSGLSAEWFVGVVEVL